MLQRALLVMCLMVWMRWVAPVGAATMKISDIPLGRVIEINGQKFIKIKNNSSRGSEFVAQNQFYQTMQTWDGCDTLATPTATNFTQGPTLVDARDGKKYEIRKFADGKCWMADNLRYGGEIDNCVGVDATGYTDTAYGGADGMAAPSNRFGTGTYGNCRDSSVGAATSSPCYDSTACGYYYNWQGAMQHASAYYRATYTGPTANVQGICPSGWHLPSGDIDGEFATLDKANGGTGSEQLSCTTASCNFWRPGNSYKGVYSGRAYNSGTVSYQGSSLRQWSAGENSDYYAWYLNVSGNNVNQVAKNVKNDGFVVRCIKN